MPPSPKLAVAVPVYLCDPSLYPVVSRCLESLRENYPSVPLVLVDDASPLPLPDPWLAQAAETVRHAENLGFTASANDGLWTCFSKLGADTAVLLNCDAFVAVGQLARFLSLEGTAIASPMDTAGTPDDRFGCCWGLTREAWKATGPLDERLRHYFSDAEYYLRAKGRGVRVEKWPETVVEHLEGATYRHVDKAALFEADRRAFEGIVGPAPAGV